jgi:hypothetical protein
MRQSLWFRYQDDLPAVCMYTRMFVPKQQQLDVHLRARVVDGKHSAEKSRYVYSVYYRTCCGGRGTGVWRGCRECGYGNKGGWSHICVACSFRIVMHA